MVLPSSLMARALSRSRLPAFTPSSVANRISRRSLMLLLPMLGSLVDLPVDRAAQLDELRDLGRVVGVVAVAAHQLLPGDAIQAVEGHLGRDGRVTAGLEHDDVAGGYRAV